jgi:hypothetical protein
VWVKEKTLKGGREGLLICMGGGVAAIFALVVYPPSPSTHAHTLSPSFRMTIVATDDVHHMAYMNSP